MADRHRQRRRVTSPRSKPHARNPKQHSGQPWQPTYFTVVGDYRSVVADTEADLDINPDLAPITATVTFTPVLASGDAILASKADPRPTIYVPVPIVGHISADGRLKLRDAPAGRQENHESLSVLPTAGADGVAYMTVDDGRVWRWNGTTYIEDYSYTPFAYWPTPHCLSCPRRCTTASTSPMCGSTASRDTCRRSRSPHRRSDEVLNLVNVTRRTGETAVGVVRVGPTGVRLNDAGDVVFTIGGRDIPDPLTLATVDVNGPAGPAGPPGPQGPIGPIPADMARLPDIADASAKSRDFATTEVMRLRGEMVSALTGLVHGVSVLSIVDDAPPTATDGDVFIVSAAPTGVFAGHANTVASMTGIGWTFHDPDPREAHLNEADNAMWVWNGTDWVKVGSVAKSSLAGDIQAAGPKSSPVDADQFVLIDSEDTWAAKNITWSAVLAALSTAVMTLSQKDIDLAANTVHGTADQFRAALTGATFGMQVAAPADVTDPGVAGEWAVSADALWIFSTDAGQWLRIPISPSLAALTDVDVAGLLNGGETLAWDGSKWSPVVLRLDTDGLEDVSLLTPQNEDFLVFNGAEWENRPVPLGDLADLSVVTPADGEVLTYDGGVWINQAPAAVPQTLDALTDVDTSTASSGQVLSFDGTSWAPAATAQALGALTDVNTSGASSGQVLSFDGTGWVAAATPQTLDALTDVDTSTAADKNVLQWDDTAKLWKPVADLGYLKPAQAYSKPEVDAKLAALTTGMIHGESVNSITNTPPAPTVGDLYIVGTTPTGAWAGQANNLAYWDGAAWVFEAPRAGESHLVESMSETWHWSGTAWVKVAAAATGGASAVGDLWIVGSIQTSWLNESQFRTALGLNTSEDHKWCWLMAAMSPGRSSRRSPVWRMFPTCVAHICGWLGRTVTISPTGMVKLCAGSRVG